MSAFVVSEQTIGRAVSALRTIHAAKALIFTHTGRAIDGDDDAKLLCRQMFALNVAAVRERYQDTADSLIPNGFDAALDPTCSPVHALKSLNCWLYQCDESAALIETPLYQALDQAADVRDREHFRRFGAGVVIDQLVADRAGEIVGAVGQLRLRRTDAEQ